MLELLVLGYPKYFMQCLISRFNPSKLSPASLAAYLGSVCTCVAVCAAWAVNGLQFMHAFAGISMRIHAAATLLRLPNLVINAGRSRLCKTSK